MKKILPMSLRATEGSVAISRRLLRLRLAMTTPTVILSDFFRHCEKQSDEAIPDRHGLRPRDDAGVRSFVTSFLRMTVVGVTVVLMLFLKSSASSAYAATLYWVGNDGANASVATNWKTTDPAACGGGNASAAPTTGDTVVFDADCDFGASWDSSAAAQITTLNLNTGYAGTVTLARSLIVSSNMTQADGVFTAAAQTLDINGSFSLTSGSFTAPSGTMTLASDFTITGGTFVGNAGTVTFDTTAASSVNCGSASLATVIVNNASKVWTLTGACTVGTFTLTAGTVANPAAAQTLSVTGDFNQNANTTFGGANLTVSFTGSGTQSLSKTTGTFSSLFNVNNSGTAQLATALTVTGQACTLTGGTFYLNSQAFTCATGFTASTGATLQLRGAETPTTPTLNSGSTVKYIGDGDSAADTYVLANWSYSNLTIASTDGATDIFNLNNNFTPAAVTLTAGTVGKTGATTLTASGLITVNGATWNPGTLSVTANGGITCSSGTLSAGTATLDINGALTISGCTLTAPSGNMTVSGNFAHPSGTFTHNSGTVTLDGVSQQVSGSTTFYILSITTATARTITFTNASVTAVAASGSLTLTGAAGNLLTLQSNGLLEWYLRVDPTATVNVSYVTVSQSNAGGYKQIVANSGTSVNGGYNINWLFSSITTIATNFSGVRMTGVDVGGYNPWTGWSCGQSVTIKHNVYPNRVAPLNKIVTYGTVSTDIGGTGAKCWITQNLGATRQATSDIVNDWILEAPAGWYWQFNRKQGYQYTTSRTPNTTWITSIDESSNWTSANDPCTLELGAGWRLPTSAEWTSADGAPQNWANYNDTYASVLKLHAAGRLYYSSGDISERGNYGFYWGSTQRHTTYSWLLTFFSGTSDIGSASKAYGYSVRCLKD